MKLKLKTLGTTSQSNLLLWLPQEQYAHTSVVAIYYLVVYGGGGGESVNIGPV